MRRQTLFRAAVAAAATIGLTAAVTPLTAGAAFAADTPTEVTIPAEQRPDHNAAVLNGAGETGYLSGWKQDGFNWTTYADGVTRPLAMPDGMTVAYGTGSDWLAFTGDDGRTVVQRNMKNGATRSLTVPPDQNFLAVVGETVMTEQIGMSGHSVHRLSFRDGIRDEYVGGAQSEDVLPLDSDQDGLLFTAKYGDFDWVEWAPANGYGGSTRLDDVPYGTVLSGSHIAQWHDDGRMTVWNKADITKTAQTGDPGLKPAFDFKVPRTDGARVLGTVGDNVVLARRIAADGGTTYSSLNYRLVAVPFGGGPEREIFARSTAMPQFKTDGTMLIARVADGRQAVVAVGAPGADGTFAVTEVAPAPLVRTATRGMSLAQGRLSTLDHVPADDGRPVRLRGTDLAVSGTPKAGERVERGTDAKTFAKDCADDSCPAIKPTGDGRLVYRADDGLRVLDESASLPGRTVADPSWFGSLGPLEVSGRYTATIGNLALRVLDLDTGTTVYSGHSSNDAYALNGSTLWAETTTGSAEALDVRTGKTLATAKVSDCDITSLQANGTNLLWECGSSASGVYDTAAKRNVALPAHQSARLGDGYVAWQQGGVLSVTDVRGTSGTRALGTPKPGEPGKGWAVDRFGGPVAYTDAEEAVHVVPTGIPTSALSVLDTDTPARANANSGPWAPRWWLNKPAASWQLTLKNGAGATVRTLTGGEARGLVKPTWDGKADGGQYATNGGYAWALTVTPADGQGAALTRTGTVGLTGAGAVARDFVGAGGPDGRADLLALTPSGRFDLRTGPGVATSAQAVGDGWTGANAMTAAIAFRDVNGDRCNDVLVRMATGELRAYTPPCGAALTPSTAYQSLGMGWNAYDTLVSPGDVDGDGRPDLVARTPGGDLYVYSDNGALGFKDPVKAGWGWGGLLIVGAGDLTGDGRGDLLARDSAGVLWTYPGNGKGGFADRIRLGGGWGGFNSLVGAGDLDGDGRPDLLARENGGSLWLYPGAGNGAFGERKPLGGGWNMYKSLY
ncbi:FG-GAP-like repeat-containing protein [Streptomyces sp. NPDC006692]|uniref:FG-GAP-like repeat-containing protein n=1 Tax=Streptomyces sp. NPDC006692 TaxID=3364758 RepID=UPI00368C88F4